MSDDLSDIILTLKEKGARIFSARVLLEIKLRRIKRSSSDLEKKKILEQLFDDIIHPWNYLSHLSVEPQQIKNNT